MKKRAILLLAHGTPESADDVPAYLRYVTGGRPIADSVIDEVKHRYQGIGRSPLTEITFRQARALEADLGISVYVGMRNWHPLIAETAKQMMADGVTDAVVICLAPQNSQTSVGLYKRAFLQAAQSFSVDFVDAWHDHPLLIRAFAQKLQETWSRVSAPAQRRVPVIFTAHSVPCRTILAGDAYGVQCRTTASAVATHVGLADSEWFFAFQSQGISGGPWIGPTVEETLSALSASGHRAVVIQPIGFVCDHVEVLYDIDIAFRQFAAERGLTLTRAASLNDSAEFIAALADLARSRLATAGKETA
jgi:ferrochelatase